MSKTDADTTCRKMMAAWDADEYALALEISHDLLRQDPENYVAWLYHGRILSELARYDDAEKALRRTVHLLPDDTLNHGYLHLGHLFKYRGDYEKADQYYRKALKLAPDDAGRYIFLGALLAVKGDLEAAEQVHRDGTRCSKGDIDEAFLNLGLVLRAQERYHEALECFAKALEVTPDYEPALVGKRDIEKVLEYLADGESANG